MSFSGRNVTEEEGNDCIGVLRVCVRAMRYDARSRLLLLGPRLGFFPAPPAYIKLAFEKFDTARSGTISPRVTFFRATSNGDSFYADCRSNRKIFERSVRRKYGGNATNFIYRGMRYEKFFGCEEYDFRRAAGLFHPSRVGMRERAHAYLLAV